MHGSHHHEGCGCGWHWGPGRHVEGYEEGGHYPGRWGEGHGWGGPWEHAGWHGHQWCPICGFGMEPKMGFRRRFHNRAELIAKLEAYLKDLEAEAQGVREKLEKLRSTGESG